MNTARGKLNICESGTVLVHTWILESKKVVVSYDLSDGEYIVSYNGKEQCNGYIKSMALAKERILRLFNYMEAYDKIGCMDDDCFRVFLKAIIKGVRISHYASSIHWYIDDFAIHYDVLKGYNVVHVQGLDDPPGILDIEELIDEFSIIDGEDKETTKDRFHDLADQYIERLGEEEYKEWEIRRNEAHDFFCRCEGII